MFTCGDNNRERLLGLRVGCCEMCVPNVRLENENDKTYILAICQVLSCFLSVIPETVAHFYLLFMSLRLACPANHDDVSMTICSAQEDKDDEKAVLALISFCLERISFTTSFVEGSFQTTPLTKNAISFRPSFT